MQRLVFQFICCVTIALCSSCSLQKKLDTSAKSNLINDSLLASAHIGISIFEPATNKFWYNYQADKFFTPASNTKIVTCYAGMKYLGDSLVGMRYAEKGNDLIIQPTGDPTLLHREYKNQPIVSFLQHSGKKISIIANNWQDNAWGSGWSWDDYTSSDMADRSPLPVYGNTIKFVQTQTEEDFVELSNKPQTTVYTEPEIDWKLKFSADTSSHSFSVRRNLGENVFNVTEGKEKYRELSVPFVTNGLDAALELLKDTVGKEISVIEKSTVPLSQFHAIKSQAADSVFKPMMHRSDNFFAEQTLLMVSNQMLGVMSDEKIIDTLLKTDFKDFPQKPNWADGSGLSRYNLFTPQDFIWLLNKIKTEFPWSRISNIFATGNTGTLTNYYIADSTFIYAKTGTLSGVVALSGYLITKKNKTLIFSVLVNNHQTTGRAVRRSIEKFIQSVREKY
ncbi:MAG: D-alanyl-D-alanine carboxypeptidase/D-alanyl-D-alanine-endopeptidase [Chitinophagaceae bacterium]